MCVVLQMGWYPSHILREAIVQIADWGCNDPVFDVRPQNLICTISNCVNKQNCWVRYS
jgi:hypothetical protein